MSISPPYGARGSKDWYVWNIILYWNGKLLETYQSFGHPSSTAGRGWGIDIWHSLTFLYEIQFRITFIWSFFYVMHIFGSVQLKSECNLPSRYNIIKDISEYSRASALCSEQLAQHFHVYMGYMGSWITWYTYNFGNENVARTPERPQNALARARF